MKISNKVVSTIGIVIAGRQRRWRPRGTEQLPTVRIRGQRSATGAQANLDRQSRTKASITLANGTRGVSSPLTTLSGSIFRQPAFS